MSEIEEEYDDLLDDSEHRWRNRLVALAAVAVLVAAGAYALWAILPGGGGSSAQETQTATVQRGSITNTLSTSGVVVAQSTAEISFGQSGVVLAVNVTLGQEVNQGDVLAEMESDELEGALATAEVNLASARVKLDEFLAGSSESDLASADQSLIQAQSNYDQADRALQDLLDGPSETDLLSAEQSLIQAQSSYDQAERALEDLLDGPSETDLLSAEQAVASAQSQLVKAELSRANMYSDSDDALAAAQEAVSKAENALENAKHTAANAASSATLARASLYGAETAYCDDVSQSLSFCRKLAAPVSSADEDALLDVVATGDPDDAARASEMLASNASYLNARASKSSADDAVDSAEADLEAARNDLEEAKKGPSSEDIADADLAVASARLSLDLANEKLAELIEGPTQDDLDEAQSNLDNAAVALDLANEKLAELIEGPTQDDLDEAKSNLDHAAAGLAVAQAKWDDAYDGPDPLDIELQQDEVRQAELSVERAREDLQKAQIIAPFDGTVAALDVELGQEISAGQAAIILNTPDALRLDLAINEADLSAVEVGQTGFASFDAIENATFPFMIDSIGTNPITTQGVVTYEARASLMTELDPAAMRELLGDALGGRAAPGVDAPDPEADAPEPGAFPFQGAGRPGDIAGTDAKPMPGMNASLTIITGQAQGVLTVPAQAVQAEGFQSVVEVLNDDGSTEKVVVQTGITDGTSTEITEGLEEGQTVILPSRVATVVEATTGGEFQQRGFFREGQPPEGGGPSFFIGPGGSGP